MATTVHKHPDKLELHPSNDGTGLPRPLCMHQDSDYEAQSLVLGQAPQQEKARQMGDPSIMGIAVFAVTNSMIGLVLLQIGGVSHENALLGMLWYTAGAGSAITAIFELILGNTFGYVVFGSFAGYYFSFASTLTPAFGISEAYTDKAELSQALGIFFCCWSVLFFLFLMAGLKTNLTFVWIFFFVDVTTWLLAASYFQQGIGDTDKALLLSKTSGGFLLISTFAGWYLLIIQLFDAVDFSLKLPVGNLSKKSKDT